jgi:hypothetical protein
MSWNEYKALIDKMDFMQRATNVYRTKYYIVRQELSIEIIDAKTVVFSKDTFFARTKLRDAQYEFIHAFRANNVNGKRVPATMTVRTYVD